MSEPDTSAPFKPTRLASGGRFKVKAAAAMTLDKQAVERDIETRFWSIVDRDGLTGLPSDMWAALDTLVSRAALVPQEETSNKCRTCGKPLTNCPTCPGYEVQP